MNILVIHTTEPVKYFLDILWQSEIWKNFPSMELNRFRLCNLHTGNYVLNYFGCKELVVSRFSKL